MYLTYLQILRSPLSADLRSPSPQECDSNKDNFDINKYNIDLQLEWKSTLGEWLLYKKTKEKNHILKLA
jgi:hypothetical protein